MARTRDADRAREGLVALGGLQPAEVGQQRGLDRLEELQRRARDEQRVEDDAGQGRGRRRADGEHRRVEQRLLGELDRRDRQRRSRRPRAASARARRRSPGRRPRSGATIAHGTTSSEASGAARMPSATADCPWARPDRDRDREAEARHRLEEHEAAVEPEPLVPGEVAAGEVAGGVGERRADEDPVQRGRVEGVLDRALAAPARRRGRRPRSPPGRAAGSRSGWPAVMAARAAVGDRPRQQLLDRPVDDRDDDEQHRPQQRDGAVGVGVQHVAGDREVGEGEEPVDAIPIDRIRAPRA